MAADHCVSPVQHQPDPAVRTLVPDKLLRGHRHALKRLRDLAGVPTAHWEALYHEALRGYATFVQDLPAMDSGQDGGDYRLFDIGLRTAVEALALRQGRLLPPDADAETLIRTQDVWTYALFSAALLVSLEVLGNLEVELFDPHGNSVGVWQPAAGPISASTVAYRVNRWREGGAPVAVPLLVHHLLPPAGVQWLASEARAFRAWYGVITGEREQSPGIGALLDEARQRAAPRRSTDPPTPDLTNPPAFAFARSAAELVPAREDTPPRAVPSNPGLDFLEWLREGLRTQFLSVNEPGGLIHVTGDGVLLVSPAIFRDYDQDNWARAQRRFTRLRLHAKNGGFANIHTYVLDDGRYKRALRGYLISDPEVVLGDAPLPPPNPNLVRKRRRGSAVGALKK